MYLYVARGLSLILCDWQLGTCLAVYTTDILPSPALVYPVFDGCMTATGKQCLAELALPPTQRCGHVAFLFQPFSRHLQQEGRVTQDKTQCLLRSQKQRSPKKAIAAQKETSCTFARNTNKFRSKIS